jgi:hypothetical protein
VRWRKWIGRLTLRERRLTKCAAALTATLRRKVNFPNDRSVLKKQTLLLPWCPV